MTREGIARRVVAGGLAALAWTGVARAQAPAAPPRVEPMAETISVTGTGRVTLTPDRASFTAGAQTMAPTLAAATQENATVMAAILAALRKAGAADKELRTSNLSISPQQAYQEGRAPRIVGYQVSNEVTVTRDDAATIGRFIEAAVGAGANTVSGVSLTVSDPARGREEGLQAAMKDARAKAEVLAKAAGRSAGRAIAITEMGAEEPPVPRPMFRPAMVNKAAASVAVEPGTQEMSFTISVTFRID